MHQVTKLWGGEVVTAYNQTPAAVLVKIKVMVGPDKY